jgi:hypothetical protein
MLRQEAEAKSVAHGIISVEQSNIGFTTAAPALMAARRALFERV